MTCRAGDIGKYDVRVLKLIRKGVVVLDKRTGKAFSGRTGNEVGSVKRGRVGQTPYIKITLPIGKKKPTGKRKSEWFPLHRAMVLAFLGLPPEGCDRVNHKDGDGTNNRLRNLEWCSAKENTQHAIHVLGSIAQNGEQNKMAKLTEAQAREIILSAKTDEWLGRKYGVGYKTIQTVRYGMHWKHVFDELKGTDEFKKARRRLAQRQQLGKSKITKSQLRTILTSTSGTTQIAGTVCVSVYLVRSIRNGPAWKWARRKYQPRSVAYQTRCTTPEQAVKIFKARGTLSGIASRFSVTINAVRKIKAGTSFAAQTAGLRRG